MQQVILAVDDNGKLLRYIPKEAGHKGQGQRHLAITVLLINFKDQALLQKRKHKIFDNIWDLTGATHPLHKQDGTDESPEEATLRCLKEEWGINKKIAFKNLGFFNYFAKYSEYCENEYCYLMIGEYDGDVSLNPKTGYEYKWMDRKEFLKDIKENPKNYTPWAKEALHLLREYLQ